MKSPQEEIETNCASVEQQEQEQDEVDEEESALDRAIRESLADETNQDDTGNTVTKHNHRKAKDGGTILNPIYLPTTSGNETWELTWPIWHMLPNWERKEIASKNGFRTIGDFEEEVILSRILTEGEGSGAGSGAGSGDYPNASGNEMDHHNGNHNHDRPELVDAENKGDKITLEQEDDDESVSSVEDEFQLLTLANTDNEHLKEIQTETDPYTNVEEGGLMVLLPDELVLHHIFPFLSTEYYAVCALVSPHWRGFTRSEIAYKEICKRCYLNQSKRKALHVARFGGSYRNMLDKRSRVKTGCGLYALKCTKIKKIVRDMWTEVPPGAILESTYYRYLNFYEDGRVLYALTSKPPYEMIPIFIRVKAGFKVGGCSTVFGSYQIQKDVVTVDIQHPWHHVKLVLRVLEDGAPMAVGKFWALQFEKHQSSANNDFDEYWSRDLVNYDVPTDPFRFLRNWKL